MYPVLLVSFYLHLVAAREGRLLLRSLEKFLMAYNGLTWLHRPTFSFGAQLKRLHSIRVQVLCLIHPRNGHLSYKNNSVRNIIGHISRYGFKKNGLPSTYQLCWESGRPWGTVVGQCPVPLPWPAFPSSSLPFGVCSPVLDQTIFFNLWHRPLVEWILH